MESKENTNPNMRFVEVHYDKFNEKTTTNLIYHPNKFSWNFKDSHRPYFIIRLSLRHIKMPDLEAILLDINLYKEDWFHLSDGEMVLLIDEKERIQLELEGSKTDVSSSFISESGYYEIESELFKRICQAQKIEVKISGDRTYHIINNDPDQDSVDKYILPGDKFLFMFRAFYSGLYNSDLYSDWLNSIIPIGEELISPDIIELNEGDSQNSEVSVSEEKKKGCFIATAAMGNYNHPVVVDLRNFRDDWLLERVWGGKFTEWYYEHGPKMARFIEKKDFIKFMTYILIVKPIHILSKIIRYFQ